MYIYLQFYGLSQKSRLHQSIKRHDNYSAQDYEKYEAKRQRIMDANEEVSVNHEGQVYTYKVFQYCIEIWK